jgi:hypothetical protein
MCSCSCGNPELVAVGACEFNNGNTKSCGCLKSETTVRRNIENRQDYSGQRFGDIIIGWDVDELDREGRRQSICLCLACNRMCCLPTHQVTGKKGLKSCCFQRKKHGMSNTKTWRAWMNMRDRCRNPNHKEWKHYGGRGIRVCAQWNNNEDGFHNFLRDVGEGAKGLSLDRYPNKNGNYEPGNIRWTTDKEQANNRRVAADYVYEIERLKAEIERLKATPVPLSLE